MKKLLEKTIILVTSFGISLQPCFAGIQGELGKVWKSIGGDSVHNTPYHYEGQRAGHYTVGSSYFMRRSKNRPLFSANSPEFHFDPCMKKGILNFGGFSHINSAELKNKVKEITSSAGLTMVYLGLSSISPVIGETVQEVYSKLQELGAAFSNDCKLGQTMVAAAGDILGQHSAKVQHIVTNFKTKIGDSTDYARVLKDFPKGRNEALKNAAAIDESLELEDINIAWKAISKLKIKDEELKRLMMTISGTIIIKAPKNDRSPPDIYSISSTVTNTTILGTLLKGGSSMRVLKCDETTKCLNPTEYDKTINDENSFESKVDAYFQKFEKALKDDEELEDSAQNFLAKSGIPAYRIYDGLCQYTSGNPQFVKGQLVKHVAWNILYNYLSDMLRDVTDATNNLKIASTQVSDFKKSLHNAKMSLSKLEQNNLTREKVVMTLIKNAKLLEDSMAKDTSNIFSNM